VQAGHLGFVAALRGQPGGQSLPRPPDDEQVPHAGLVGAGDDEPPRGSACTNPSASTTRRASRTGFRAHGVPGDTEVLGEAALGEPLPGGGDVAAEHHALARPLRPRIGQGAGRSAWV
jgi:hypothetical protein